MMVYLLTGLVLLVYLVIAFLTGSLLHLQGPNLWVLRGGLAVIGIAGAAVCVRLFSANAKKKERPVKSPAEPENEIQLLVREAEAKIAAGRLSRSANLGNLPAIFLVGEGGSAKTTTIMQSGLEPELVAGQVHQENAIVPTRLLNIWFAANAVFVEAGAKLLGDASKWATLMRGMQLRRVSALGKGQQAPRAVVVCMETGVFLRPGASEQVLVSARNLRGRLMEMSKLLGIDVPVYVLFTKLDQISFFNDFVNNLQLTEVDQIIGVTLPFRESPAGGVHAEETSRALSEAFEKIFAGLSAKRPDFLSRENSSERLPGTYEFPREFRKLRTSVVKFLVELCRPTQLTSGPFLRGFYFCGVRPVIVNEVAPAPATPALSPQLETYEAGATRLFRPADAALGRAPAAPLVEVASSRKVPQWVFLSHFFPQVVLADRTAFARSESSTKVNFLRRAVLAGATLMLLLLSIALAISFSGNRQLESTVLQAAQRVPSAGAAPGSKASLESLRELEALRQALGKLVEYDRGGPPLHLRWGLYSGTGLYPAARKIYFDRFRELLFGPAQAALLATLGTLPAKPGPDNNNEHAYDTLKAYLITSSHHEKSTQQFLAPLLLARWAAGGNVDTTRLQLAQRQFDFYSRELQVENPYSSDNDTEAVRHARNYLLQLAATEPVYQAMLAEANRRFGILNFNAKFPGSAEVVVDNRNVAGAYSKDGWSFMQDAIQNPGRYFKGEEWVLGGDAAATTDPAKLHENLKTRYYSDFIGQWRDYIRKAGVVSYQNLQDADQKLGRNASPESPLLAMFCLASENIGSDAEVVKAFKAVQTLVPAACADAYVAPGNGEYMRSLSTLKLALDDVLAAPQAGNDAAVSRMHDQARSALNVVAQMALTFGLDPQAHLDETVRKLLEAPITTADALLQRLGPEELNSKGKEFCAEMKRTLLDKGPFNPRAQLQANLDDVNSVFRPGQGILWTFYAQNLNKLLTQRGNEYYPDRDATTTVSPSFLRFFNNAVSFSRALYPNGSANPQLSFSLHPVALEEMETIRLSINGQAAEYSGSAAPAQQFAWPGSAAGVRLTVSANESGGISFLYPTEDGLWGIFSFFSEADSARETVTGGIYEWRLTSGTQHRAVTTPSGKPVVVQLSLDMGGLPNVFRKGYWPGLSCVSDVAK